MRGIGWGLPHTGRSQDEKESPVSAIAGSILGLAAFMLAFTFGIVWERHDLKRGWCAMRPPPSAPPGSDPTFSGNGSRRG